MHPCPFSWGRLKQSLDKISPPLTQDGELLTEYLDMLRSEWKNCQAEHLFLQGQLW